MDPALTRAHQMHAVARPLSPARIVAKIAALVNKKNANLPIWRCFGFKPNEKGPQVTSSLPRVR